MASPRSVRSRTAASISAVPSPGGRTSRVTCGSSSAAGGKSHSCVTPTTSSPSPSANSSSVAWGTRLTMRIAMEEDRPMALLSDEDVAARLEGSPWRREGDEIVRDLKLADFAEAMAFVNRVAEAAEAANHHPDILVHGWNRVRLSLTNHAQGGLTEADFALAAEIDGLTPA